MTASVSVGNAGTGHSISLFGDDRFGVVTLTTGTGADNGLTLQFTFDTPYGFMANGPRLELTGADSVSNARIADVLTSDLPTDFISQMTGFASSTTYRFAYHVS